NPRGVETAPAMRRVFGDIGRSAAIFAAEREPLQTAQEDQDRGRKPADAVIARRQTDQEGRQAHDGDGDEEGVFASDQIADPAEHQRAERADQEAGGERQQREYELGVGVERRVERLADLSRGPGVEIEIVPLEYGA